MINQQLLDFIKGQLQLGKNKETISKELSGGGWATEDIQEGFNAINIPTPVPIPTPNSNPTPISNFNSFLA